MISANTVHFGSIIKQFPNFIISSHDTLFKHNDIDNLDIKEDYFHDNNNNTDNTDNNELSFFDNNSIESSLKKEIDSIIGNNETVEFNSNSIASENNINDDLDYYKNIDKINLNESNKMNGLYMNTKKFQNPIGIISDITERNKILFEYQTELKKSLINLEQIIINIQKDTKFISRLYISDSNRWQNLGKESLLNISRNLYETELYRLSILMSFITSHIDNLSQQYNEVQLALENKMNFHLICDEKQNFNLLSPWIDLNSDTNHTLLELERVILHLIREYISQKEIDIKLLSFSERKASLLNILYSSLKQADTSIEPRFYYHPNESNLQNDFNNICNNRQYNDGVIIAKWLGFISKNPTQINHYVIIYYIHSYKKYFIQEYDIPKELYQTLSLYLERLLFFNIMQIGIFNVLLAQNTEIENKDKAFIEKRSEFSQLSQLDFGIDSAYCFFQNEISDSKTKEEKILLATLNKSAWLQSGEIDKNFPYWRSINYLSHISELTTPTDKIFCLYKTIQVAFNESKAHYQLNKNKIAMIGTDDLFPIILFVIAHCVYFLPYSTLYYLEIFLNTESFQGMLSFCLTTFQAAIDHLAELDIKNIPSRVCK